MSLSEVRLRPGMYIGDTTDGTGLHNMIFEVVNNAANEVLQGFADSIEVMLNPDGSCTVRDNGRGIPTDLHPTKGVSAVEVVLTQLHAGWMLGQSPYNLPGERHGVGIAVVNALSERLELRIWRAHKEHHMCFADGAAVAPLRVEREGEERRGTEITFRPASDVFADTDFNFARVESSMRELADHLAAHKVAVTITVRDQRPHHASEVVHRV